MDIQKSLSRALTQNNGWILILALVLVAFHWVMRVIIQRMSMIYYHETKWMLFGELCVAFICIFSPPIFFAVWRSFLRKRLTSTLFRGLWVMVFLVYPFLIGFGQWAIEYIPVRMNSEILLIIGLCILATEMLTNPKAGRVIRLDPVVWQKRISAEWIIVALFVYLSLYGTRQLILINKAEGDFFSVWLQTSSTLVIYYLFYLINHYFLVQKIYRKKGVIYYAAAFTGLMILFYPFLSWLHYNLPANKTMIFLQDSEYWIGPDNPGWGFYAGAVGLNTRMMILTIPMVIFVQWVRQTQRIANLEKENSETELAFLKQQISPHFFFNTLNSVYSMSLTKEEKTPEAVLQLSDLMRYAIYKGKEAEVTLSDEIKYMEDYLELQKLRFRENVTLTFEKNVENHELTVAPLLFIVLIENAIKHGIEGAESDAFLQIKLTQNENTISFSCLNSFEESVKKSPGLGLENLKRRLELAYPDRHSLEIIKDDSLFSATLVINLDNLD